MRPLYKRNPRSGVVYNGGRLCEYASAAYEGLSLPRRSCCGLTIIIYNLVRGVTQTHYLAIRIIRSADYHTPITKR
jgi:hypothetical protein